MEQPHIEQQHNDLPASEDRISGIKGTFLGWGLNTLVWVIVGIATTLVALSTFIYRSGIKNEQDKCDLKERYYVDRMASDSLVITSLYNENTNLKDSISKILIDLQNKTISLEVGKMLLKNSPATNSIRLTKTDNHEKK